MINIKELAIPEVKLLMPVVHRDNRGYVTEIVHERQLEELDLAVKLVQENQSLSIQKHTVRGMHSQKPPYAQAKFVRVLRGRIFDVAVDMRRGAPTFGKYVSVELSEDDVSQLFIPTGFAHGFCTLEPNTVVLYKMSQFYAPGSEVGFIWNDPDIGIQWPVEAKQAILSGKDEKLPRFKDIPPIAW
jgi:dTDP-4-dehydrorhamnose 3,5-epimerase